MNKIKVIPKLIKAKDPIWQSITAIVMVCGGTACFIVATIMAMKTLKNSEK